MLKILATAKWLYGASVFIISLTWMILSFRFLPQPYAVKISSWMIRIFLFSRVIVKGKPADDVQMFLLNHQSELDISTFETLTKKNLAWVAKKEIFDTPFFGYIVKLPNDIPVERESKTSLVKLLHDCKDRLSHGRVITIFPEGTRSTTGRIGEFKPGAKMIADKLSLKVQPVVLVGSAAVYSTQCKHYSPGTFSVVFMEPFIAERTNKTWAEELRKSMQEVHDRELANLVGNR